MEEQQHLVETFLDDHNSDGWIIDGNYGNLSYARRADEADCIVLMLFGKLDCLFRCAARYRKYKGTSRPDLPAGCLEKMDWEFVKWILWESRTKKARNRYERLRKQYPDKVVLIRNQRQLDFYWKSLHV